jgi:hypothetical protein
MAEIDKNIHKIEEAQSSRIVRAYTETYLLDREEEILNDLCNDYKMETLTDDKMRGHIAGIFELREFRRMLETNIRKGMAAAEKELGQDG